MNCLWIEVTFMDPYRIGEWILELYNKWRRAKESEGYDADWEIFMSWIEEMIEENIEEE